MLKRDRSATSHKTNKMLNSNKQFVCNAAISYESSAAVFPLFFLLLPGTGLVILRGRAFPPLTLKSTVAICKITPSHEKLHSNCHRIPHIQQISKQGDHSLGPTKYPNISLALRSTTVHLQYQNHAQCCRCY